MKNILILHSVLCFCTTVFCQDVVVTITEIDSSKKGHLYLTLFNKENGYPENENALMSKYVKVVGDIMTITFSDLQNGMYAINVLHDENSNRKIDTNFIGIPNEGYGFSNNPWLLGPPSFDKTKFKFEKHDMELTIQMKY